MRPQTRLIGLLSLVFLLAVLTSYLALQKAGGATSGIWFEVAKLGLQLAGITMIGGMVSLGFRLLEKLRDDDRRLSANRQALVRDIISSYEAVKSARRILRALGLRSATQLAPTPQRAAGYHEQMILLSKAQLAFERVGREGAAFPTAFADPPEVLAAAATIEKYLHELIKEWEDKGPSLAEPSTPDDLRMDNLQDFIGDGHTRFHSDVAGPLGRLVKAVYSRSPTSCPSRADRKVASEGLGS
jgi:uncharacterized membrane protein YhdT